MYKFRNLNLRFNGGDDNPGGGNSPDPTDTPPTPEPTPTDPPADPAETDPASVDGSPDGGKTFSAEYVEKLRRENAAARTERKEQTQQQIAEALEAARKDWTLDLGRKLGVVEEDAEPTPDQVIETVTAENAQLKQQLADAAQRDRQRAESDAIAAAVTAAEGDPTLVKAVLNSEGLLKDIDPTSDDYAAQVAAVVAEQVEKNPRLRAVQVAPRSGGDDPHTGDPAPGADDDIESMRSSRRKRRGFDD
ncbi:hypothetical protein [Leifsonia aquatica]|uniref:hypothetical protein n=1 Tax=Leifsonia aquatica TaxID=144185 RepID=UPI00382804BE